MSCKRTLDDPAVREKILENYRDVGYITVACKAAGVHVQRFSDWQKRWREGDPEAAKYDDFFEECETILAQKECDVIRAILSGERGARQKTWYAARRWPHRWGQRTAQSQDALPAPPRAIEAMEDDEVRVYIATLQEHIKGKLDAREQYRGGALPGPEPRTTAGDPGAERGREGPLPG